MITNEEARKAIEKYQKEHPLNFGAMIDVTAISSKAGAEIISRTVEEISKKIEEDTDLWCICEMAKMYMQGVKPVYPVKQQDDWIPARERLPDDREDTYWVCTDSGYQCQCRWTNVNPFWTNLKTDWHWVHFDIPQYQEVVAWKILPEPYEKEGAE